jgi:DNA-binding CsgD family transcriptional regulator/MFS family permease
MVKSTSRDNKPKGNSMEKFSGAKSEYPPVTLSLLISLTIGFSGYWACFFILMFGSQLALYRDAADWQYPLLRIALLLGIGFGGLLISWKADYFAIQKGRRVLNGAVMIFPAITGMCVLMQAGQNYLIPLPLGVFAWFVTGLGIICLGMLWAEFLTNFATGFTSRGICLSVVLGALLFLVTSYLPFYFCLLLFCILPFLSIGILQLIEPEVMSKGFVSRADSKESTPLLHTTDAFIVLYGVVFGFAINFALQLDSSDLSIIGIAFSLAGGALALIPWLDRNKDKMLHGSFQKFLFPLLVIGLLPMPFTSGLPYGLCVFILIASYMCFSIVNYDSLIRLASHDGCSPLYLLGRGRTPLLLGTTIGYAIGLIVSSANGNGDDILVFISLSLTLLLAVFVSFVPFEKDRFTEEYRDKSNEVQDKTGRWRARCLVISGKFGLSARETEIFNLLAKGHGTEFIQNKLFISAHTVKTHTYNIYKKMKISSREELIALVEEMDYRKE